jgi:hypothetical protein
LREAGVGDEARLVTRSPGYLLEVAPAAVDWHRFRALVSHARAARQAADLADAAVIPRPCQSAPALEAAVSRWRR